MRDLVSWPCTNLTYIDVACSTAARKRGVLNTRETMLIRYVVKLFAALSLIVAISTAALAEEPSASFRAAANVPDGYTFAAVGDLLQASPLIPLHNRHFLAVNKIIRGADVAFGNAEMPLIDVYSPNIFPAAENGETNIFGLPSVARDLKEQGFTIVARANNHSTDWGVEGMEMTDALLDAAGIVHAGTGRSSAAARAARFADTRWGRIGLASTTSTFEGSEVAGEPADDVVARPGASVLHTTQALVVVKV